MHTYIIAEAGSTHDGRLEQALELVQIAKDAGADACKFQYWSDPYKLAQRRSAGMELATAYHKHQVPTEWLTPLCQKCKDVGIDFMCTAYLPEDIEVLGPHVAKFKVASFEALDTNFILDHLEYNKDIIVSTGMMDARETHRLLGLQDLIPELKFLHCVSAYPAPLESLNLSVIREMGLDGFSDHSGQSWVAAAAVAAGARIIEVHFRADNTPESNPDFEHSLDPLDLEFCVQGIRDVEKVMGDGIKVRQAAESAMAKYRVVR
jgi:N-acetylneuraminate synthase